MAPGVIWVSSRVSHLPNPQTNVDALTPEKFCDWYENIHIQEVTALSGVPRAARYEASTFRHRAMQLPFIEEQQNQEYVHCDTNAY